jgi:RNA polymerase-binding transcription factor DksA
VAGLEHSDWLGQAKALALTWVKVWAGKRGDIKLINRRKVMQSSPKTNLPQRKVMLEGRLIELGARLEAIEEELDSHHNPDWSDLATEREGDEVLEATGNAGLAEIPQIRAALKRIEDGSYGLCVRCGAEIAEARLDVLPWTPFCRSCAR